MLRFFRQIRQRLLSDNKFSKYLLYAVGEIFLVVIGILIALQVNNWNLDRQYQESEHQLLIALKEEFEGNRDRLNSIMVQNETSVAQTRALATLLGPELNAPFEVLDSLLTGCIMREIEFRDGNGTLKNILSSGKLDFFQSVELKSALSQWEGHLEHVRFQEKEEHSRVRMKIMDLGDKLGNLRKAQHSQGLKDLPPSKFLRNNQEFYSSIELDNLISNFYYIGIYLNNPYYSSLLKETERILAIIDAELERFKSNN